MANSTTTSSSSSTSPIWLYSYVKLQFFNRIRRFLRSKAGRKRYVSSSSDRLEALSSVGDQALVETAAVLEVMETQLGAGDGSRRGGGDDVAGLQRAVKRLHFGRSWEEKEMAALEIQSLAKHDVKLRKLVAELGVIPVLVTMAASDVVSRRRAAVAALVQLANGTYTNKALMVEAGILSNLPKNTNLLDEPTKLEFAELLLTLSSLANTPFPLASSEIVPFLIGILESSSTNIETMESCIGTLCNLSNILDNAGALVSNGVVDTLLKLSSTKELSEKVLGALGCLVVTLMGKKAMENSQMVPETLIEILTWDDKPKCQELSAYILMILAHQSSAQRQKMAKSGIVQVLLEVALLGSPLAQKRSLKLLQWFRDERQAKMGPHSGPQTAGRVAAIGSPVNERMTQEGKKMMKSLVKQSLHKNMEMITRRANADGESSNLKALVISTSSKSLPY
ncbi:U-box domain-containing protein 1 [Humulus lupulus]|uniref:U-box domain-containing protein 1 n=1 Tax=Humulus lupulus TaxID=3486 RepID=UPI002B40F3D8|nr:U-box domain-containing protein 1 [Humulus lupulus]